MPHDPRRGGRRCRHRSLGDRAAQGRPPGPSPRQQRRSAVWSAHGPGCCQRRSSSTSPACPLVVVIRVRGRRTGPVASHCRRAVRLPGGAGPRVLGLRSGSDALPAAGPGWLRLAGGAVCCAVAFWAQQFVEQGPVPQQRLAQVFGARLLSLGALPHGVREPVVLDGVRMVDRYQLGLCIEVLHRVTPRFHDTGDEVIGSGRGLRRLIDEALLHVTPFVRETQAGGFWQRLDVELSPLPLTCAKVGLGGSPAVAVLYRPVVFRAEALTKHRSFALPSPHRDQRDDGHHSDGDHDPYPGSHQILLSLELLLLPGRRRPNPGPGPKPGLRIGPPGVPVHRGRGEARTSPSIWRRKTPWSRWKTRGPYRAG